DPKLVPAGIYAREYLEKIKIWTMIKEKVVPTDNVRAALSAVEAQDAEAALVYKTDTAISKRVRVCYEVPANDSPTIRYPVAILKKCQDAAASKRFFEYVNSKEADQVFARFGFIVLK